ncbi:hypothetical protein [Cohnella sp. GbtcB17]|uniref:hypothetical protein n=1 Tax=Cohnella sp. GbtcB17 TaxID=2824762 RepID=UPI001C311670|nr:hypothetical protein [Cohnella sp. GbtcB17]
MAGIFFILAAASSIAGLLLYDPILNGTDCLAQSAVHGAQVVLGAAMEPILVVSAVGTAAPDAAAHKASGILLKVIHDWTFLLGPNFMLLT